MEKQRYLVVSALTQYDERERAKRNGHNPYFLGIALGAVESWPEQELSETEYRKEILTRFNGRLRAFVLKTCGQPAMTPEETRYYR